MQLSKRKRRSEQNVFDSKVDRRSKKLVAIEWKYGVRGSRDERVSDECTDQNKKERERGRNEENQSITWKYVPRKKFRVLNRLPFASSSGFSFISGCSFRRILRNIHYNFRMSAIQIPNKSTVEKTQAVFRLVPFFNFHYKNFTGGDGNKGIEYFRERVTSEILFHARQFMARQYLLFSNSLLY